MRRIAQARGSARRRRSFSGAAWRCSPLALDALADAETLRARRRAPHRLAARAACHDDDKIARLIDDGDHRILIVLVDPDREDRALGLAAVPHHAPRLAEHFEHLLLH